jgi:hypothetical protein
VKGLSGKDHCRHQRPLKGLASGLSRRSSLLLIAIALAVTAALTASCDGGQDGASGTTTPTGATPTDTSSPEQQLLEQVVLRAEDLPAGLTQVDAGTSTNEDVAAEKTNPEEELSRLQSLGRVLGYNVSFVPGSESPPERGIMAVSSAASLYLTAEGASASFADDAQAARDADWLASYPNLTSATVKEIERPELADEVVWMRITGFEDETQSTIFIEDFVVLRQSRVRGYLRTVSLAEASAGRDAFLPDLEKLAGLQVQRIDAALEES